MKTNAAEKLREDEGPAKTLIKVLGQNEHVRNIVEECAVELSSTNLALKNQLSDKGCRSDVENALEKNEAVEIKVQEVSEKLSVVNSALQNEVLERQVLAHQLADVMEQEGALHHAAFHDPLTGLPNRALFNDRLEHGLAQATRHGWSLALMFVDLDDFKIVNDMHGHHVGDAVLKTIAKRLGEIMRVDDTICRHGGDEFLCLLMEAQDKRAISLIAGKIINTIQAPCDSSSDDPAIRPSIKASIGISIFPQNGTTAAELIKSADIAMYRAKRDRCGYSFAA